MAAPGVIELSDENFDAEVLQSSRPILVDFWAAWCQPCLAMGPTIDLLAQQSGDKYRVGKLNIDDAPLASAKIGVTSIPTFVIFRAGQEVRRFVGMEKKENLQRALEES